jgi:DNA-binding CsgD family transcriptional regulator
MVDRDIDTAAHGPRRHPAPGWGASDAKDRHIDPAGSTRSKAAVVEDLYEGVLAPLAWDRAIAGIADHFGASGACLVTINTGSGVSLSDDSQRGDPAVTAAQRRQSSICDEQFRAAKAAPVGQPVTGTVISKAPLTPAQLPHFMQVTLQRSSDCCVVLIMRATSQRGPFSEHDVAEFNPIIPHISRTFAIKNRLHSTQWRADSVASLLKERLPFGVLLLDPELRILETNVTATRLMRVVGGLEADFNHGMQVPELVARELRSLCKSLLAKRPIRTELLKLKIREFGRPISLLVAPISPHSRFLSGPTWLVFVFDDKPHIRVDAQLLRIDLGISAAESAIAASLTTSCSLTEAAANCGISIHTARNHLKSIFAKTELQSQTELVKKILTGPAVFSTPSTI